MATTQDVTLEDALLLAQRHHETGNLTVAERTYLDILASVPNDFNSHHYLGIIQYQKGDPHAGIEYIKKAIEIDDTVPETWNAYAVMLGQLDQHEEALKKWEKAIEIKPDFADAYSNMGNSYWTMKQYDKAQEVCEKAIEIKPDFADAYVNLAAAISRHGENDEDAVPVWEKAIELDPQSVNAMVSIGNALRNLGRLSEAEQHCRKALEINPRQPHAYLNLGNALKDQGQFEEAELCYKRASELIPNFTDAHNNRALVLIDLLRYDEAITAARYALAFDPNYVSAHSTLSFALRETGQLQEAEEAGRKALVLQPDSVEARIDLADTLFLLERMGEAELLFNEALEMDPDSPRVYIKMAAVLERTNRTEQALEAIDKAIELSPEMPDLYQRKATIYLMSNQVEKALESVNKAIELNPEVANAYSAKSEILQSAGDMEAAREAVEMGLSKNDKLPALYLTYTKVKKLTLDDPYFDKIKAIGAEEGKYSVSQLAAINFTLFKVYEDNKDYESAFKHLKIGNDYKRSSIVYDVSSQNRYYENTQDNFTDEFIDSLKDKGHETDVPVFIVGMPRSGTTLTEQIISSHPDVYGAGELTNLIQLDQTFPQLNANNCAELGKAYLETLKELSPDIGKYKRVTDKMPGNFVKIGQILTTMPGAKIIHCRRNPIDTCLSCYKQLFARGQYWSYNLDEMADYYALYYSTMAFWRERFPDQFLEIRYEETVNDFENQARKLVNYVGLDWNDACLEPHKQKRSVLTASKGQVRKPIYKTSIEAWRRYEEQLTPLAEKLKEFMD